MTFSGMFTVMCSFAVDKFSFEPPRIQTFPPLNMELTLGKTVILNCLAVLRGEGASLGWSHNGTDFRNIGEDPFCTEVKAFTFMRLVIGKGNLQDSITFFFFTIYLAG